MARRRPRAPHAALGLALALVLLGGAATGCGGTDTGDAQGGTATGTLSPSPKATPPEVLCTQIITYWSRRQLKDDTYGDYQSMGLSDGQFNILRDVVDAARAELERGEAEDADRLIERRARAGCDAWYREGGPSNGPWG
ncbi:hypothetical protein [Streptomyces sp. NPDC005374]|uniref:hypothetical protein n=1 Tax=Streptomyces sp. NPDC005374 TaxID=3364713 RepID=UPI0036CBE6DA